MPQLPLRPFWQTPDRETVRLYYGHTVEVMRRIPAGSVQCICTSPPYWNLRDYETGHDDEIGRESTPEGFVRNMVDVFGEARRVLRDDGVLWLNLGDSYRSGNLVGIPWRVALALQADGWTLLSDLPWVKRSAMPESVANRPAKALEYVFLLSKGQGFFDMGAVRRGYADSMLPRMNRATHDKNADGVPGQVAHSIKRPREHGEGYDLPVGGRAFRNSDLWFESVEGAHGLVGTGDEMLGLDVTNAGYSGRHFATYPEWLIEPLIKAGTSEYGACGDCGAPWRRVTATVVGPIPSCEQKTVGVESDEFIRHGKGRHTLRADRANTTTGWQPTCECHGRLVKRVVRVQRPVSVERGGLTGGAYAPTGQHPHSNARDRSMKRNRNGITGSLDGLPRDMEEVEEEQDVYEPVLSLAAHPVVPCRVMDPFIGSGTTCAVALRLGRRSWGIDLSETYLREHAIKRIGLALLQKNGVGELSAPKVNAVQL